MSSSSSSNVRGYGEGKCKCGLPLREYLAITPWNYKRLFEGCSKGKKEFGGCNYFKWLGPEVPVTIIPADISLNEELQRLQREFHRSERLHRFYESENMGLTNRVRVLEFDLAKKRATIQKTRAFIFLSSIAILWLLCKCPYNV
ncbi:hypothetical protein LWI29_005530 [Acer saccharum]|uniref:Uncharacterized protein n=1 Tax=Acer saccharum TaxID=4024 RepID=A0AA39RHE1_ACESA|nr:hypothetical protein LWI29_019641 [Acer saccharum]KAK0574313.1 hypothetical protein LWI29_021549 [Acer saccharum]KAK0586353.1 hypothetical protein LWI29_005530 [Acer saccharum]